MPVFKHAGSSDRSNKRMPLSGIVAVNLISMICIFQFEASLDDRSCTSATDDCSNLAEATEWYLEKSERRGVQYLHNAAAFYKDIL